MLRSILDTLTFLTPEERLLVSAALSTNTLPASWRDTAGPLLSEYLIADNLVTLEAVGKRRASIDTFALQSEEVAGGLPAFYAMLQSSTIPLPSVDLPLPVPTPIRPAESTLEPSLGLLLCPLARNPVFVVQPPPCLSSGLCHGSWVVSLGYLPGSKGGCAAWYYIHCT